jgi:hypothetical protein
MNRIFGFIAVSSALLGSLVIASNIGHNVIGYSLFLLGGITSLILMRQSNIHKSMQINMWIFIAVDILGIIRG